MATVFNPFALTRASGDGVTNPKERLELARLSDSVSVHATGRGNPTINFSDGREVITDYEGPADLRAALEQNQAQPQSLATADFDEDGVPDLVSGYGYLDGGLVTILRGNVDAIYPNAPEAQQRRQRGEFTRAPFLSPGRIYAAPTSAEFIGAGDFDGDSHWDLVVASRTRNALYFLPGDGRGGLGQAREISLPGVVTAMSTGEINRRDGLTDVVVGIGGIDGASVMVFEGAEGALRSRPEEIRLKTEATSLALGDLDDGYEMDLAVAAGSELMIIHGRDRKLSLDQTEVRPPTISRLSFSSAITSLAIGDFSGNHTSDLALMTEDGRIRLLSRTATTSSHQKVSQSVSSWKSEALGSSYDGRGATLASARVSSLPGDDLLIVDSGNRRLQILNSGHSDKLPAVSTAASTRMKPQGEPVALDMDGSPAAVLPMKLNGDAVGDLMILKSDQSRPSATLSQATATFTVTNTNGFGAGSLYFAILDANETPGADVITFNIAGAGAHTILQSLELPEITEAVMIDGTTQPGYAGTPLIRVGSSGCCNIGGLTISGGNSGVRGLALTGFSTSAIFLTTNGGSIIDGNYFGTDQAGTANAPSSAGISVISSSNNTVGGTVSAARNHFAHYVHGVKLRGIQPTHAQDNQVQGNFFGTDLMGTTARGNAYKAIVIESARLNTIGGTVSGARNLISGNLESGIFLTIVGIFAAEGNLIQGNLIGTTINGTAALANVQNGILIDTDSTTANRFPGTLIGGTTTSARNTISSNGLSGILIQGANASGVTVQGNFIGTDVTGTAALGNALNGITTSLAPDNTVGGSTTDARNIISGNGRHGISIGINDAAGATGMTVQNNYIGTDVSGSNCLGNLRDGIFVNRGSVNHKIANNLITCNGRNGVNIPNFATNDPGIRIEVTDNSIYANAALGIELGDAGITPNDPGDADVGANFLQNFPVLTSFTSIASDDNSVRAKRNSSAAAITVNATLNSTPNTIYTIHWYFSADAQCTTNQQGSRPLVSGKVPGVTTDINGNASFSFPFGFPAAIDNGIINCTATDPLGNTSEFSTCLVVNGTSPTPGISINDLSQAEGNDGATLFTFGVTLSNPSSQIITVNYASANGTATIADNDYSSSSGMLTFSPGQTSKPITVSVNGDRKFEPDETFLINLSGAANAIIVDNQGVGTITNDDSQPSISINDVSQGEGNSSTTSFIFTISLSNPTFQTVTVQYATTGGTASTGSDYQSATGTLTFNPGDISKPITVLVNGDTLNELDETFLLNLSGAGNGTLSDNQGVGTIANDDAVPSLSINDISVTEGNSGTTNATFTVTLSAASGQIVTVQYASAAGTATAVSDYQSTSGALTFNPGDTSKPITVLVNGDTTFEPDETFFVNLSGAANASIADSQAVGTILNDDVAPGYTPPGSNVTVQGNGLEITFSQVSSAGITTMNSIPPSSAGTTPGGYVVSGSSVAFEIATTAAYTPPIDLCFAMPSVTDPAAFNLLALLHNEGGVLVDRTVSRDFATRRVCGRVNSLSPFVVTSKITVQFNQASYSKLESGPSTNITVTRTGDTSGPAAVNFSTGNNSYVPCNQNNGIAVQNCDFILSSGTLNFAPGQASKSFPIIIIEDLYVEGDETITLNLSGPSSAVLGTQSAATLTLTDNDGSPPSTNPLDIPESFVQQHYYDFLGRLPDQGGLDFWVNEITQCGPTNTACINERRVAVSNAFFFEPEYQQTARYVFLLYRASYGNDQPFPNPDFFDVNVSAQLKVEAKKLPRYLSFVRDRAQVVGGSELAQTQLALANAFVQRPEFITRYPTSLSTGAQFVDAVLTTIQVGSGVTVTSGDRNALIAHFTNGGRGLVMFHLANDYWNGCERLPGSPAAPCVPAGFGAAVDNRAFIDAEYTRSFIYSQYSGYLRRDGDIGGFMFWLTEVSKSPARNVPRQRAMVCSFMTSTEYQQRLSPLATHNNSECPPPP
ncbi:MAG: Calx-beta domain-containing protein [Pyrinomonadaceae bacterium]